MKCWFSNTNFASLSKNLQLTLVHISVCQGQSHGVKNGSHMAKKGKANVNARRLKKRKTCPSLPSCCLNMSLTTRSQLQRAVQQRMLLSEMKRTTSQSVHILYESITNYQINLLIISVPGLRQGERI